MGLLDQLFAQNGYGIFGGNYPSTIFHQPEEAQAAREAAAATLARSFRRRAPEENQPPSIFDTGGAAFGLDPSALVPQAPQAAPPMASIPGGLPSGPTPMIQPQPPMAQPQAQPAAAMPAPQDGPSGFMNVGNYRMPQFGPRELYTPQAQPSVDMSSQNRQPTMDQQQLPPAIAGNQPNGFLRGLQSVANGGGLISALTGNYNDPASIQRQNLKAQYDALVPMVGPQRAMLAVMNPEAGKIILERALSEKQKFTEIGVNADGTKQYGFVNDREQSVQPYTAPGSNVPTTMTGPDGQTLTMPAGADPKTWRNEITKINADAAAGKKTEVQAKSEKFGNRMEFAERSISALQGQGTSLFGAIASGVPLGNYAQSKEYQKYAQAKSSFIQAMLRDESGAAIGTPEFVRLEKEMFPQPGDGPDVIAQKAEARKVAVEAMKKSAGPGYKSPDGDSGMSVGQSRTVNGVTIKRIN